MTAPAVTVHPQEFKFVSFDATLIERIAAQLAEALGIDRPMVIEVDETTPLAKVRIDLGDTITLHVESGAFEDSRQPRRQSETATTLAIGRALLRCHDRLSGGFGECPPDDQLDLRQIAAWDTYCVSRLARLGVPVLEQRWRYNFRNRHGFHDRADQGFERVWSSTGLTWGELESISQGATA